MTANVDLFIKVLKDSIMFVDSEEARKSTITFLDVTLNKVREEAYEAGKQEVIDNAAEYLDRMEDNDEPIRDESHD
jgi:hypothetical protein